MTVQNNLSGKTALVTGASRGIGRATALSLAQAGAQVIVHYGTGESEAAAVVTDIRSTGGKAEKVAADLRTADGPHRLAERVRAIIDGPLDVLVANAGIARPSLIAETTIEDFDALFAVNVRAPYFLVQQLSPAMRKGSSVIMLSSLAARAVVGNLSAYAATKGAIDTLVKHFASALGGQGIRVNAVAPGVVPTEMSNFAKTAEGRDLTLNMQALKRMATAEEIAAAITFLASDQAQWITGDTLRVDGGSKL
jgi:3-oxoacyl-[acyl-carrier protein] reductase